MHNSKLRRVLEQFTKGERKSLLMFVHSPYHCSNSKVINLLTYFLENISSEDIALAKLDRSLIWNSIAPDEEFNYIYLRKIASDSIKLVEEFMIAEQMKHDYNTKIYLQLEYTKNKKNKTLQDLSLERYEQLKILFFNRRNSVSIFDTPILKNIFILNDLDKIRYQDTGIDNIIFELDKYYITEKLKLLCDLLSRNWDIDISQFALFSNIINLIESEEKYNVPSILVYYYIYLTIVHPDNTKNYYLLKQTLLNHHLEFDPYEAKSIFDATISFGTAQINKGNVAFSKEVLSLYKLGLSKSILTYNNNIDAYHFKIIIMTGLRLSEFDWVEYFIDSFSIMISEEERENTRSYNMAMLNFYKKNYTKVLSLLQQIEYEDLTYNLGAKSMLLATYYEMDEYEPLSSLLDSFKVFLNRKKSKIPSTTITDYQNLIKFTRKLLSINFNDHIAISKLESEINNAEGVASKKWLLEKIEQLR